MALVLTAKQRISSGQRDQQVTIQQRIPPSGGFPKESWDPLATVAMSRQDVVADERYASNQVSAYMQSVWQLPYRSDMDPDLVNVARDRRLVLGVHVYNIVAAATMDRRTGIELRTLAAS